MVDMDIEETCAVYCHGKPMSKFIVYRFQNKINKCLQYVNNV